MKLKSSEYNPVPIEENPSSSRDEQKQGLPWQLNELYLNYYGVLVSHVVQIVKDHHIAEELVQETFIKVAKLPEVVLVRKPQPYLKKIATNTALDYLRKLKKIPKHETDDLLDNFTTSDLVYTEQIAFERRVEALYKAIDQLPSRAKEAFILARLNEMTIREVAKELGISQTMVEKHLRNAMRKCCELMHAGKH